MATFDAQARRRNPTRVALVPGALAIVLLGLGCPSDPTPMEDTGSSSSTETMGMACNPGQMQACTCTDGSAGLATCNALGTGFGACACAGATEGTTAMTATAGTTESDATTTPADSTATTSETTSTGTTDGSSTTGEPSAAYGPCIDDIDCMVPGEICVGTGGATPNTVCMLQDCADAASCPPAPAGVAAMPECADITGRGVDECFLACDVREDCPDGMICFTSGASACVWPP
jgi:hypothetical protein